MGRFGAMIGERLGPYEIEAEIGRGGMGCVYRAVQPSLGRTVAVKTLMPHLVADEEFLERFLREARATAKLSHPGIVTIHDVGDQDGVYYFAMEYLSGRTLDEIVQSDGALAVELAVNYVGQIAAALAHAHSVGILHRDVKPSNVLVDESGRAVLTDFGIAWAMNDSRLTRTGTAVGSPDYMSPEQVEGGKQDQRSDLYALGVLFYQLLTGETPYQGETPLAVAFQHVNGPVRSPREANPDVPAHIDAVVRKLLAKKPNDRYGSADELLAALSGEAQLGATTVMSAVGATTVMSAPAGATTVLSPPTGPFLVAATKRPSRRVAAAVVAAVVTAGLAYGVYQYFATPDAVVSANGSGAATGETPPRVVDVDPEPADELVPSQPPATATPGTRAAGTVADGAPRGLTEDPASTDVAVPVTEGASGTRPGADSKARARAELGGDRDTRPDPGPPVVAAPAPEVFLVTSRPEGAVVKLDGVAVEGVTPVEVDLLVGKSYRIGVELDGYESTGFEFTLESLATAQRESSTLHFPLASSIPPGVLVVTSEYPLSVRIGDQSYEIADRREISLAPGDYDVTLEAPGVFLDETRQIVIASGAQVPMRMTPLVSITIAATPSYCRVQVDGRDIGFVPATILLVVGAHDFAFDWERLGRTRTVRRRVMPGTGRIFVSADDGGTE